MLDELESPYTLRELVARVRGRAAVNATTPVVAEMLKLLQQAGALREVQDGAPRATHSDEPGKILVALSGGIAAAYAPAVVELLQHRGLLVRVAATKNARRFVSSLALEALTQHRVVASLWPNDPLKSVPHLELASWADVVAVYPATATTLSRIVRADCSTVVSALAISARSPVILFPAMNRAMLRAPAVQRNLIQLRQDGFWIARPALGYEVAEAPGRRQPAFGAAPPVQAVVDVISAVFQQTRASPAAGDGAARRSSASDGRSFARRRL
jgi:phosphopantothenoylcysteine decarboxylase/phosphopantothenate--cysteine ligase